MYMFVHFEQASYLHGYKMTTPNNTRRKMKTKKTVMAAWMTFPTLFTRIPTKKIEYYTKFSP